MTFHLAGLPNVGKSALFNRLTGSYATVSNYPGTTVEIFRGRMGDTELVDLPGMYSLVPISEEERVGRDIILASPKTPVVLVADAKNLERSLPLAFQLLEAGIPLILCLNMLDEARKAGLSLDTEHLETELGIPVVAVSAVTGEGLEHLRRHLRHPPAATELSFRYPPPLEAGLEELVRLLPERPFGLPTRFAALMLLKRDAAWSERLRSLLPPETWRRVEDVLAKTATASQPPPRFLLAAALHERGLRLARACVTEQPRPLLGRLAAFLDHLMLRPLTGIPILVLVLWSGLYKLVGEFAAGTLVDLIETDLFEKLLNPLFVSLSERLIPWPVLRDLLTGEYGLLTLGLRYAVAIILPIVAFFFLVFAVIEDSGYLPRLALLVDRLFKRLGLSGRAVIPMVLGLGCVTMGTLVTRTLPTRRERLIATLLLSLAVPCSAQLGVIMALLAGRPAAFLVWVLIILAVYLLIGSVTARVLPGAPPSFYMELPPLRLPRIPNLLAKTLSRLAWYFGEVLPLFLLASGIVWLGQITGLFDLALRALAPVMSLLGLPRDAAIAFIFGFFRRDYGAAGLYDLARTGRLGTEGLLVASVVLTLFLPCIAQFVINIRERGWKSGLGISGLVLLLSLAVGTVLNLILSIPGVNL